MLDQLQNLFLMNTPQIMALIISYLEAGVAADVLTLLPEETQSDIIHRIATLETVQPDALAELEELCNLNLKQIRHYVLHQLEVLKTPHR